MPGILPRLFLLSEIGQNITCFGLDISQERGRAMESGLPLIGESSDQELRNLMQGFVCACAGSNEEIIFSIKRLIKFADDHPDQRQKVLKFLLKREEQRIGWGR